MIKMYGNQKYTLAGAYVDRRKAIDLVESIRFMNKGGRSLPKWYARFERCLDYTHNPPKVFYRVWQRQGPEPSGIRNRRK